MSDKEKLVELLMQLEDNLCDDCGREPVGCAVVAIADHLIAHGVMVQETTQLFCTGNDEYYGPWGNCRKCGIENICGSKFCRECGAKIEVEI